MTETKSKSARRAALDILLSWQKNKAYINKLLSYNSSLKAMSEKDTAFCNRLCLGVIERKIELDFIISRLSTTPIKKLKPSILVILELGIYQLKYMDSSESFAVCNEMTALTKEIGLVGLSGFVNAILRNYLRKSKDIANLYPKDDNRPDYLNISYSIPKWLCRHYINEIGFEEAEKAFGYFLEKKALTARLLKSKLNITTAQEALIDEGIAYEINPYLDYVFDIQDSAKFLNSEIFKKGYFQVQDLSSILVGEIADPDFDINVLDICAAPGGKSLHLADIMAEKSNGKALGNIVSRDIHDFGVELIRKRAKKASFNNVFAQTMDATVLNEDDVAKYDLIIADLPCSGLGVIGKKPDIKYYAKEEDLKELSRLQFKILENAVKYLKQGGSLIYSTCTVSNMENKEQADRILSQLSLEPANIKNKLCRAMQERMRDDFCIQLLPGEFNSDGFFISKFFKK